jgi:hypothetical protein
MSKKHPLFVIFILFSLLATISFLISLAPAEEIDTAYEHSLTKAVNKIEKGEYEAAIHDLKNILKSRPQDEEATLYLGIALSHSGDEEAEGILKKALSLNPENPRTNLELGIYYYKKSLFDEAEDYFSNTITIAPNTELSANANEYIKTIKHKSKVKPWALNISAGGQYDSNVILNSEDNPLPEGVSQESDWKAVLYLRGSYNLIPGEKFNILTTYSLYQSLHAELSDFNTTSHLLNLDPALRLSSIITLKGSYAFQHVTIGGDAYDYSHSFSPVLIISEGKGFSTIVTYRYRKTHFMDAELFEDNSDRTGFNNLAGITQEIPLGNSALLRISYQYDKDSTSEDFWDYTGNKGLIGVQLNLSQGFFVDLSGEYYNKNYDGIYPSEGRDREDDISTASLLMTKALSNTFSLTVGQLYTKNKSNIGIFDYNRAITSFFINARF